MAETFANPDNALPPQVDIGARFDNSFARELDGGYVSQAPAAVPEPRMLKFNTGLANELGLNTEALDGELGAQVFSGNIVPSGAQPLAQAYAGHQFGGFSAQLGDGRALLLGEILDSQGRRRDVALKGSGRTPFSRGGDGKAAVGPVLREYLMGEAMHRLGIPTTRALAAVATGEGVFRDIPLPGAVLTRVAASHLRVGTFQFFAARGQTDFLRTLTAYVIDRHYPDAAGSENPALSLLGQVARRQAALIARWMQVGFIHGVMNTDNMALSGETIDYGPCAFLEAYDPKAVFSSIDTGGRYSFGNQPLLARWNLTRFAETLIPLIDDDTDRAIAAATEIIDAFTPWFDDEWQTILRRKLGLSTNQGEDAKLAADWLTLMHESRFDFTLSWRALADTLDLLSATSQTMPSAESTNRQSTLAAPLQTLAQRSGTENTKALLAWQQRWLARLHDETQSAGEQAALIRQYSPVYIARNHLVEHALDAAVNEANLEPFEELLGVLAQPFTERPELARFAEPAAPDVAANYKTFCGT